MKSWYKIENKADKAEIWIYEQIGEDFWSGGGVTAKDFQKELSEIKASQIDLHINSPGGQVFEGVAIYNMLKQHKATITTYIDGIAASIASVIALAGDRVVMAANALFMMHNPSGIVMGTATDMRKTADVLDKVRDTLLIVYTSKSTRSEKDIVDLLEAETWMNAEEAIEAGFADEIGGEMDLAACAKFIPVMAKAGFKQVPEKIFNASNEWLGEFNKELIEAKESGIISEQEFETTKRSIQTLKEKKKQPTAREIERILRDGGCSEKLAKVILAEGYRGSQRDVDPPPAQRDVAPAAKPKKDPVADLLTRAEMIAPSL